VGLRDGAGAGRRGASRALGVVEIEAYRQPTAEEVTAVK